jgi:hypothetical protein
MNYLIAVLIPQGDGPNNLRRIAIAGVFLGIALSILWRQLTFPHWALAYAFVLSIAAIIATIAALFESNRSPDAVAKNFSLATCVVVGLILFGALSGFWTSNATKPNSQAAKAPQAFTYEEATGSSQVQPKGLDLSEFDPTRAIRVTSNLGPIDQWRFDSCMTNAAQSPTQSGVVVATGVCKRKFNQ